MDERKGILSQYQLWDFWDSLPAELKKKILSYFEETPLMFDYKNLFQGNWQTIPYRTPINILNVLMVCTDLQLCDLFFTKFQDYTHFKSNDWYWVDTHFFLLNYSGRVYKMYLNGICDEGRFLNSWNIENKNNKSIITSLEKKNLFPLRNPLLEQYLIYLEKRREFNKVIALCELYQEQGWKNDFNKRLMRCKKKLMQK